MTAGAVARRATIGLVLVRHGAASWLNDAARWLVERHGTTWDGPCSPLEALAEVHTGARRTPVRWPSPTGGTRWWQVTCEALDDALLYEISDETDRYDADGRDLGPPTAQWRLARLEAMSGMGSWVWNLQENLFDWSESLLRMFGLDPGTRVDYADYRSMLHPDDVAMIEETQAQALAARTPFQYTHRMFLPDGTERVFECHGEVFANAAGTPTRVLGTARDITDDHRARAELAFLAEHDPLTGIANRRRITTRLAEVARDPRGAALLLIDIDNFKDINDLRGHAVGDRVIRRIARTVAARIPPDALLGRLGGDEFAVVVPFAGADDAVDLAERLCDAVAEATIVDEAAALRITASIGIAIVARGEDVETSLAQADLALYEAKNAGRNRARLFAPDHYHQAARRVSLLQRVGAALDNGTMQLDAQPIVDLATGRVARHELLIRLRDGLEPPLGPADFLPAAERTDLVLRLDRWVLERAVAALATPRAVASGLRLEVNVSARSLEDDDLGRWILDQLKAAEVAPQRLGLEITETTAIDSLDAARVLATRLTEAGCGFALDDFGAGFASFSYLKHLPFTAVKIAGEFVRLLDSDPVDCALVTAVVGVAKQLGMRTVAEQVDRDPLVHKLRTLGVDDGQGFHLGRPRPLKELLDRS